MSRVQHNKPNRRTSDFSIARILADNTSKLSTNPSSSLIQNSPINSNIKQFNDKNNFYHGENILTNDNDKSLFRINSEFVNQTIVHSPSTSGLFQVIEQTKNDKSTEDCASDLYWLQCTRYRPPKIPRKSFVGKICKRRPASHPRIPFSSFQLDVLEEKYKNDAYLSRKDVIQLSTTLRLPHSRVSY